MAGEGALFAAAGLDGVALPDSHRHEVASTQRPIMSAYRSIPAGPLPVSSSSPHYSSLPQSTYSNLKVMTVMNGNRPAGAGDTPVYAANACACCRNQKRRCDKQVPSCSRCIKMKTKCNYHWDQAGPQLNPQMSVSDFLLFHIPVTGDHMWFPGTFESLQPYQQNIDARRLDIDRFFGGLAMTTIAEQNQSLAGALDSYFVNIHPWLPVIHERTFHARACQLGVAPEAEIALILLAMLLVLEGQGQDSGTGSTSQSQLYNLCRYLFSFLQMGRSPSLELVQAALLLAVYELGSGHSQAASLSIGMCARLGYVLRLNVDSNEQHTISWVRGEEQRRVWLGVYMLDRLIHQVERNPSAPHAVEDPPPDYRLPIDDREWDRPPEAPNHGFFQPAFSTPLHIPLCYFAREIQAVRILGQVQMLSRITDPDLLRKQMDAIDGVLMQFMERLFEQTPGSWEELCGANATTLMAGIILHHTRLTLETATQTPSSTGSSLSSPSPSSFSSSEHERSILALRSLTNMVRDICAKFSALDEKRKLRVVPLPSLICTGESARVVMWLNQTVPGAGIIDFDPFRTVIAYAARSWGITGLWCF
ncbi:fungal-specific transcription factor domain-containing protein [Aspergillus pseudoustus]|uniref:Fungal-specific transcription factor domain-containing protein n=1 Tax=Aspergillus pseudoustus TaxID=1810923 RepID=A0ABR4JJS0_9EURO